MNDTFSGKRKVVLFTTCKRVPSLSVNTAQKRALQNWCRVFADADIVVFGASKDCGGDTHPNIHWVADVQKSESGIPFFNAMLTWCIENTMADVLIYANADILFPEIFHRVISDFSDNEWVGTGDFLLIGQRIDLSGVEENSGVLHPPSGMDYFVFRPAMFHDLPALIPGRGGYDSALVVYCLRKNIPVVDMSGICLVRHMSHDYSHLDGGKNEAHYGMDAEVNFRLHRLRGFAPHCVDAQWAIRSDGCIVKNPRCSFLRKLEVFLFYKCGFDWCPQFNRIWNIFHGGGKW